jgi:glyoxylase-like metal-dependent hydrolase (beta-lactamase superfamily II)
MNKNFYFQQLFESQSSTYTYLLADQASGEAVIIDPVDITFERDVKLINELGFKLKYILETHIHADHITSAARLKEKFAAQIVVSSTAPVTCADKKVGQGERVSFGSYILKVLSTQGHTETCLSFYLAEMSKVFTGDALLIRGCGRTDFQEGNALKLYQNVHSKLFTLPDSTIVYPGHDYKGFACSSIGEEKKHNPRLGSGKTADEFKKIMGDLKLDPPKRLQEALPANLLCGNV